MMDTPLAASPLNLDAAVLAKTGAKADKTDGDGKKSAFKDALDQQVPSRSKGNDPFAVTEGDTTAPDAPDAQPDNAASQVMTPRPKKPLVLLGGQFIKPAAAQSPASDDTTARTQDASRDRTEIRQLVKALAAAQASTKADAEADAAATTDMGEDTAAAEVSAPKPARSAKHAQLLQPGSQTDATDPASKLADSAADSSAKDMLGLLQDNAPLLNAVMPKANHAMTSDTKADGVPDVTEDGRSSSPQQNYRLSRADGKGGVLDIPGPDMPSDETATQASTPSAQVTVIDQRRFLAPAQDNALSVIHTISGDKEWTSAMRPESALANAASVAGGGKVVNTLKIQMHPIDLGLVTATLRLSGEELSVDLKVETGAAYRQLKEDQSRIVEALRSQGFNVDQVNVVMAPDRSDTSSNTGSNQSGGQGAGFAQQQQSREGGQGAATGRERRAYDQERAGNGTIATDDGRVEGGSLRGPGGTRSGGVYL